jgi:integrase
MPAATRSAIVRRSGRPRPSPSSSSAWSRKRCPPGASHAGRIQGDRDWILPALGRLKAEAVTREAIERLHRKITEQGKLRRANAVKSLVATLFSQGIIWKMCADNPATGIKGNPEHGRQRYLRDEELERLEAAMDEWRPKHPDSVDIIEIGMNTGARFGEILSLRWRHVDLDKAIWGQPATETKQRDWHSPVFCRRGRSRCCGAARTSATSAPRVIKSSVYAKMILSSPAATRRQRVTALKAIGGLSGLLPV